MGKRICMVCQSSNKIKKNQMNLVLCNRHYQQIKNKGKIWKTSYEPNDFIEYRDRIEILLYDKNGEECARTKIDKEDYQKIKGKRISILSQNPKNNYATLTINGERVFLHHFLFGRKEGMFVDHKNRKHFDNRKNNLRHCTRQENSRNSECLGVHYDTKSKKWRARIGVDYKRINLGFFEIKNLFNF